MLLVQQAQHPTSSALMPPYKHMSNFHRRNPSAPAAVVQVQPTKTPGLLSLSKPPQARPHHNPSNVNARHPTPRQPKTKPSPAQQGPSPERQRGRVSPPAKDKTARHTSKSRAGHGGRARQPSPSPISVTEQASTDENATPKPVPATLPKSSSPSLLNSPSGRLAKRRNRAPIPFPLASPVPSLVPKMKTSQTPPPAKAKAVPVPFHASKAQLESLPFSRSDPVLSHFPRVRRGGRDVFPICDDNDSDLERPSTPSPTRRQGPAATWQQSSLFDSDTDEHEYGPRTAPISSEGNAAKHFFPSPIPSPSPTPLRSAHKRTPSVPADAMYNLSFESDNELNMSFAEGDFSALFGRSVRRPRMQSSTRSTSTPNGKIGGAFAYASSTFQNSPSPEQLPPPTFSFAAMKEAAAQLSD